MLKILFHEQRCFQACFKLPVFLWFSWFHLKALTANTSLSPQGFPPRLGPLLCCNWKTDCHTPIKNLHCPKTDLQSKSDSSAWHRSHTWHQPTLVFPSISPFHTGYITAHWHSHHFLASYFLSHSLGCGWDFFGLLTM